MSALDRSVIHWHENNVCCIIERIMAAKIVFDYRSLAGATFSVSPGLTTDIEGLIDKVRAEIATSRAAGRFIGYVSVPISSKSGGDFKTNTDMAAHITQRVQR